MKVVHGFIAGASLIAVVILILHSEALLAVGWTLLLAANMQPAIDDVRSPVVFAIFSILAMVAFVVSLVL